MGRPPLTEQRHQEILDALERCVLRDGLAATTVAAVAAEAGCQRTLIHHYFGDVESLVHALVVRLTHQLTESFLEASVDSQGLPGLLDHLFRRPPSRPETLIGALRAPGTESANETLVEMYETFTANLDACLRAELPGAAAERCRATAFAVVCLAMSQRQLGRLGVSGRYTRSLRRSAETLIDALGRD